MDRRGEPWAHRNRAQTAVKPRGNDFVSSIRRDNVMAVHFHPEESRAVGPKILENVARHLFLPLLKHPMP